MPAGLLVAVDLLEGMDVGRVLAVLVDNPAEGHGLVETLVYLDFTVCDRCRRHIQNEWDFAR